MVSQLIRYRILKRVQNIFFTINERYKEKNLNLFLSLIFYLTVFLFVATIFKKLMNQFIFPDVEARTLYVIAILLSLAITYVFKNYLAKIVDGIYEAKTMKRIISMIFFICLSFLFINQLWNLVTTKGIILGIMMLAILCFLMNKMHKSRLYVYDEKKLAGKSKHTLETYSFIILIILTIVGFTIRYAGINNIDLQSDEGLVYFVAKNIKEHLSPILPSGIQYFRGILHEVLVALSLSISDSTTTLRMPSVLFGTLVIVLTYLTAKEIFDKRTAILSTAIISISLWEIIFSQYARFYIIFQSLFLLNFLLFYLGFIKYDKGSIKAVYIISVLFSVFLSEQWFVNFFFFLFLFWNKKFDMFRDKKTVISIALLCIFVIIWYVTASTGMISTKNLGNINKVTGILGQDFDKQLSFNHIKFLFNSYPSLTFLILLGIVILLLNKEEKVKEWYGYFVIVCPLFIITILDLWGVKNQPRFIFFLFPLIVIMASSVMTKLLYLLKKERTLTRGAAIVKNFTFISLIVLFIFTNSYFTESTSTLNRKVGDESYGKLDLSSSYHYYEDFKTTVAFISNNYRKGDKVIIITSGPWSLIYLYYLNGIPIDYLLRTNNWIEESTYKNSRYYSLYYNAEIIKSLDKLKSVIKSNNRVWVIGGRGLYDKSYINQEVKEYLDKNKTKMKYRGQDKRSKVYLFEKESS